MADLQRLRYAGTCSDCSAHLPAGTRAHYDKQTRTVTCASCTTSTPGAAPVAGGAATAEAERAAQAADRLTAKAGHATRRAAAFARGAAGEQAVAATVADLTRAGWFALHDRALPDGGNLDHVLVGPAGVVVVDAKNWSTATTVTPAGLRSGGRDRTAHLDALGRQAATVGAALAAPVPVLGVLALTGEHDHALAATALQDLTVVGLDHLAGHLAALPGTMTRTATEEALRTVSTAFPPAGEALAPEQVEAHELFYATHRFLFLTPWARGALHRIYLTDADGVDLGWKDAASGTVTVTHAPDTDLVRAILTAASSAGMALDRKAIPRTAASLPLRWKLVTANLVTMSYLVGYRWRRGGADRVYGTYASRSDGVHALGYIDLATGRRHPSGHEPLTKELREPDRYLKHLHARLPR